MKLALFWAYSRLLGYCITEGFQYISEDLKSCTFHLVALRCILTENILDSKYCFLNISKEKSALYYSFYFQPNHVPSTCNTRNVAPPALIPAATPKDLHFVKIIVQMVASVLQASYFIPFSHSHNHQNFPTLSFLPYHCYYHSIIVITMLLPWHTCTIYIQVNKNTLSNMCLTHVCNDWTAYKIRHY